MRSNKTAARKVPLLLLSLLIAAVLADTVLVGFRDGYYGKLGGVVASLLRNPLPLESQEMKEEEEAEDEAAAHLPGPEVVEGLDALSFQGEYGQEYVYTNSNDNDDDESINDEDDDYEFDDTPVNEYYQYYLDSLSSDDHRELAGLPPRDETAKSLSDMFNSLDKQGLLTPAADYDPRGILDLLKSQKTWTKKNAAKVGKSIAAITSSIDDFTSGDPARIALAGLKIATVSLVPLHIYCNDPIPHKASHALSYYLLFFLQALAAFKPPLNVVLGAVSTVANLILAKNKGKEETTEQMFTRVITRAFQKYRIEAITSKVVTDMGKLTRTLRLLYTETLKPDDRLQNSGFYNGKQFQFTGT